MTRPSIALTALAAAGAIAPYVYAAPHVNEFNQATLTLDAVSVDQLQGDAPEANPSTANAPDTERFDEARREQLDSAADAVKELPSESSREDAVLELIVIEI